MTAPSFSFTLAADPAAPLTTAAAATAPAALAQRPSVKSGLLRPFRLDGKGGFARVSGDALLEQKLENLLLLDGLPWAPERTSQLDSLRHMNAGPLKVFAGPYISDAVARLLPELRVEDVSVTPGQTTTIAVRAVKVTTGQDVTAARLLR